MERHLLFCGIKHSKDNGEIGVMMNILYISNLTGNLFAGPSYSVPAQIKAQSKIDCVLWYNLNYVKREEWGQNGLDCKNFSDFPSGRLKNLPKPFCNPDLAVVEEFYCYPFSKIIRDIQKQNIPYIIIPRSELTKQAQQKKAWKKRIGNFLYFKNMARKATAIQYLSQQEYVESGEKWNKNSLIIPNGIDAKENYKNTFSHNAIKAVYIGRYEQYQKGLDILFEAIAKIKEKLKEAGFQLSMYGVDQEGTIDSMKQQILEFEITDLIHINDAIYGQEKERVLIQSDIFVLTSRFEGMPMGMLEALSYGLPVIATEGTNMANEIERENAGWVSDNSVEGIVNSLLKMLRDQSEFESMGKNALMLAKRYSWDSIAQESHLQYERILK